MVEWNGVEGRGIFGAGWFRSDGWFGRLRGLAPCGLFVRAFLSLAFCWGGAEEIT